MGLFDFFKSDTETNKELSWEEENAYKGDTPNCPKCGTPLTKR